MAPITCNIPPREGSKRAPTLGETRQDGEGYAPGMPEDRRRFAQTCPKFDHQLGQVLISNKALTNTFLALVQTFAMLVMFSGEDCSIDIMGVLVRSKLSYANKG